MDQQRDIANANKWLLLMSVTFGLVEVAALLDRLAEEGVTIPADLQTSEDDPGQNANALKRRNEMAARIRSTYMWTDLRDELFTREGSNGRHDGLIKIAKSARALLSEAEAANSSLALLFRYFDDTPGVAPFDGPAPDYGVPTLLETLAGIERLAFAAEHHARSLSERHATQVPLMEGRPSGRSLLVQGLVNVSQKFLYEKADTKPHSGFMLFAVATTEIAGRPKTIDALRAALSNL